MPAVDRLYDWLAAGPTPGCDRILGAALDHAKPPWAARIANVLLKRGHVAAWGALACHFTRLPKDVQTALLAAPEQLGAAVAWAIKSPRPDARAAALIALALAPCPRYAYVAADALRDPDAGVRATAGTALRAAVSQSLDRAAVGAADAAQRAAMTAEHRQLSQAVQEAWRTFTIHHRVEALELGLWLARDIGDALWRLLSNTRSRAGVIVAEKLCDWNHPRLARFLVSCLKQSAWRHSAARLLETWTTPEHLTALLRESELLDDLEIARGLASVQAVSWFTRVADQLDEVPAELRAGAPRWARLAGLAESERVALLVRWAGSRDEALHRAAVYALSDLEQEKAIATLRSVSESQSPLATFARWCLLARESGLLRPRQRRIDPETPAPRDRAAAKEEQLDRDFARLWQACRRTPPAERVELISLLRARATRWRARLQLHLQSPDARDRLLALQVLSTRALTMEFRHDLRPLVEDPVDGIRRLTQALLRSISAVADSPVSPSATSAAPEPDDGTPLSERLEALLRQLNETDDVAATAALIAEVRQMLQHNAPQSTTGQDHKPATEIVK